MHNVVKTTAALAALTLLGSAALAQTQTTTPPPAKKPGFFSRMFHPKPKPGIYQNNATPNHPMNGQPMHGPMNGHSGMMNRSTGSFGAGTRPGMMGGSGMGGSMLGGRIVGNKNSHVYHMPGDGGSLPAPQNRVYFSSAAAAQAAGYHAAGGGRGMMHNNMTPRGGAQVYH